MTKMQSLALRNGVYQQNGPLSQSPQTASQFSCGRNQQNGTANKSNRYMTVQTGARPQHNAQITHYYGAYIQRQPTNWQITAVPHQAVHNQQKDGGNNYLHPSPTNLQSRNPTLQVTYRHQQTILPYLAQNSSIQSPPNMTVANIANFQQKNSGICNQSVVSARQHYQNPNSIFHYSNGASFKPVSPYTATATSHQHREVDYNGRMGPAAAHQRPPAHDNNRKQNGTQHGFNPPCYNEAFSQLLRTISKNSSSGHNLHASSTSHISQQYSIHNNGGHATSSINTNSNNGQYETNLSLSKPNDSPSNPSADAQQEILKRRKEIGIIEDYLRMPSTTDSDGRPQVYTGSPYGQKQDVSMVTMMESNQNMQPVTPTIPEMYNSNASQSIPQHLRHSSPKATDCVILKSMPLEPLQSVVPNVSAKGDANETVSQAAFFAQNNVGTLSGVETQLLEGFKPQINENQSSVENNCERHEILSDSSIHSLPGHTRAVAVVQPLLHESYQVASKQNSSNTISQLSEGNATDESLSNPEQVCISPKTKEVRHLKMGPYLHPENPSQMRSNKYAKQLCTVDAVSKLDIDTQIHQLVATTAQESVTVKVPVSQNGDKDKSERPIDAKRVELSSIPTTPWTPVTLTKYIQDFEKSQSELKEFTMCPVYRLLNMFWNGDSNNLKCVLKTGIYTHLMKDIKQFYREHITPESVILSQVQSCFETQLKNYHVLKDEDVYSELPYKSSWLNVNEQLDDIDKEFDFPPSLKHHLNKLESDCQLDTDDVETNDSISAKTVKVSNKMCSSTELEISAEKQDSFVEATTTQTVSPNKIESADSTDPYSFKIQVFPPEEAKVIFQQVQSSLPESTDMDYQPAEVSDIAVEGELPKVIHATLSNSKLEIKPFCPIEEACCTEKLMETIWGSLSKCQCKIQQSHKDNTAKTCDKEVMAVQEKDVFRSDGKLHSATERENQENGVMSINNQAVAFLWPEIINVFSHTIDLPEDDKPHSHSDQDRQNIDHISINSSQSSILLISDDEEDLSSSESATLNQMLDFESDSEQTQGRLTQSGQSNGSDEKKTNSISGTCTEIQSDPEVECVPDQLKSTENMQSCTLVRSDKKKESLLSSESEVACKMTNVEENCGQAQLTSTNMEESSLETEEQTQISATSAPQTTWSGKLKRPSSPGQFLPLSKKSKKCKSLVNVGSQPILEGASKSGKTLVHATDGEPPASANRTVDLVLFGSTTTDKCVLQGSKNNHISSPEAVLNAAPRPPKVLTVSLSPLKRKSIKTVLTWDYSVKRLYKRWKISLPPAKVRRRIKLKVRKFTFGSSSEWRIEKADTIGPADTEELPVSSEMRLLSGKTKPFLNLRWKKSLSEDLACDEEKTGKPMAMLKQPADQERNNAENGNDAVTPLQNLHALKYSVLPVSFNFESYARKETKDPVPEKPDLVEGKDDDNNHKQPAMARGKWYSNAEKKKQFFPPAPCSLFHTFQKKYIKRMQPCVDK